MGIIAQWTEDKDDAVARSQIAQLIKSIESTAKSRGKLLPFQFQNDAWKTQSPLRSYGSESLSYLQKTSKKYDPDQVFQKLQNGGFLISRA